MTEKVTALVVFGGELNPDVDAAIAALRQVGFKKFERLHPPVLHPLDAFLEVEFDEAATERGGSDMTQRKRQTLPGDHKMRIVSINDTPTVCDDDGSIRADATDLNKILDRIDEAEGRNDALRAYIYALRDLQRANDRYAMFGQDRGAVELAQAAVAKAFDRLIVAEFALRKAALQSNTAKPFDSLLPQAQAAKSPP